MTPPLPDDRQPTDLRANLSAELEALKRDRDIFSTKALRFKAMLKDAKASEVFVDGRIAQISRILELLPTPTMTPGP